MKTGYEKLPTFTALRDRNIILSHTPYSIVYQYLLGSELIKPNLYEMGGGSGPPLLRNWS